MCAPQRIPSPLFVLEIWKACFVGLIECPEGTEELKWTAFTFLKVRPSPSTESLPAAAVLSLQVWLLLSPELCQSNQFFFLAVCPLGCPHPTVCPSRHPPPHTMPLTPPCVPWDAFQPHSVPLTHSVPFRMPLGMPPHPKTCPLGCPTPHSVPPTPHNVPLRVHPT